MIICGAPSHAKKHQAPEADQMQQDFETVLIYTEHDVARLMDAADNASAHFADRLQDLADAISAKARELRTQ